MIIIKPISGLANRLRVIASALYLAELTNNNIKLMWLPDDGLNCSFLDLFQTIKGIEFSENISNYKFAKASTQENVFKRVLAKIINKAIGVDYCIKNQDFPKYFWKEKLNIIDIISNNNNIYIETDEELTYEKNFAFFDSFRPIQEIQKKIDKITANFNENTVGIHIRRSDNSWSIENSPTALFIKKMEEKIQMNNNVNFYLATDSAETESELKNKFPNKIHSVKKELSRNTRNGMIDAVVDLFCLSRTQYIYGSFFSSFSQIAARIGNIECKVISKQ